MKRWSVTATVSVDLNMDVLAESRDEAERMLDRHLSMSASMSDLDNEKFEVWDDCIEDICDVKIHIAPNQD